MFQAYLITCRVNGKRYIGITSRTIEQRWREHVYDSKRRKGVLWSAMRRHGLESFTIEPVCQSRTWQDICAIEPLLIEQWGSMAPNGYNVSTGGEGAFGAKHSPESIERSASKHRGRPCHPNTKDAAVRTHSGKPKSVEHREKIAATRKGKPRSPETKAKLAAYWAERRAAGEFKTSKPYEHARKAASAQIAKIPLALAKHIGEVYYPRERMEVSA